MSFWRAVAVLVSGTAIGHGITAAALPLITRLYSPEDFGNFASFAAIVATFAVAACLRYEIAIALPEDRLEAISVAQLSIIAAIGCGLVAALIFVGYNWLQREGLFFASIGQNKLFVYIPLAVFVAGVLAVQQNWLVREKEFTSIAQARVVQSASTAVVQILAGFLYQSPLCLLAGYLAGFAAASGMLVAKTRVLVREKSAIGLAGLSEIARKYSSFPKYSAPESVLNSGALQLPILLIASVSGAAEAGYIILAMSVLQAPMSLIGSAVGQVFLSRAAEAERAGDLNQLVLETVQKLGRTGVGPIIMAAGLAPLYVPIVFGGMWTRAGDLMLWMGPWFVMQFLTAPTSLTLQVARRQRTALLLQAVGFAARLAIVAAASLVDEPTGEAFALANFAFYTTYLVVILTVAGVSIQQLTKVIGSVVPAVLAWAVVTVALVFTIEGLK